MKIIERIKKLCEEQKITFAELERKIDLSNGQIARWKKQTPGVDKIQKVADYFNVSVDYLIGRTENPEMHFKKSLSVSMEEQKYYYRLPYVTKACSYLNYDSGDFSIIYDNSCDSAGYQTKFTKSEYASIAKEKGIPEGLHKEEEVMDDE